MRRGFVSIVLVVGFGVVGACVGEEAPNNVNVIVGGDAGDGGTVPGTDSGGTTDSGIDGGTDSGGDASDSGDGGSSGSIGNVGGLAMWFSADQGVVTSGFAVTKWTSHGGAAIDLTPIVGATPPSVTANGIGGKPTIRLEGTVGNGTCPCPGLTASLGFDQAQPLTVIALINKARYTDNTYNYEGTLFSNTAQPAGRLRLHGHVAAGPSPQWGITGSGSIFTNGFTSNDFQAPHVISAVFSAGSSLVRIDGAERATGNIGVSSFGSDFVIGTDGSAIGSFQGEIGELAVFKRALSAAEMAAVEGQFKFIYGLK